MKTVRLTYYWEMLRKWLLMVTLFFSIFTFSGYAGESQTKQQQVTHTELIITTKLRLGNRTISFKKATEFNCCTSSFKNTNSNWTNTVFVCNLLTTTKLKAISRQCYRFKPTSHVIRVKTIPQSSEDDLFENYPG